MQIESIRNVLLCSLIATSNYLQGQIPAPKVLIYKIILCRINYI